MAFDHVCIRYSSVQRRFTKRLPTLRNMSYNDRLRYLNIPSLELRRLHADLFWCYKVVFKLVLVSFDDLFVFSPCQVTRGHAFNPFVTAAYPPRRTGIVDGTKN